jgi:hypothetical protein
MKTPTRKQIIKDVCKTHQLLVSEEYRDRRVYDYKVKTLAWNSMGRSDADLALLCNELKATIPGCLSVKFYRSACPWSGRTYSYLDISLPLGDRGRPRVSNAKLTEIALQKHTAFLAKGGIGSSN